MLFMPDGHAMTDSAAPPVTRLCARCVPGTYRRINRVTLLERTLFTWLGYYPWECVSCRRKRIFRDQGRKSGSPVASSRREPIS